MTNVNDILELCMNDLENGADPESILAKYPDHADELRPILNVTMQARAMAVPVPSAEVMKRNRTKILRRAAQMREWDQSSKRGFSSFQGKWVVAFVLLMLMIFSGSNLISASATALPGDGLYTVKRWWEQIKLSNAQEGGPHDALASEIANERIREIRTLFEQGLSAKVDFVGVATSRNGDVWKIASIPVLITSQTEFPDGPLLVGLAVRVYGVTRGDQVVIAERIEYLPANSGLPGIVPLVEPSATPAAIDTEATSDVGTEAPTLTVTPTPSPTVTPTSTATYVDPGNLNSNANDNSNNNSNDDDSNNNDSNNNNNNGG